MHIAIGESSIQLMCRHNCFIATYSFRFTHGTMLGDPDCRTYFFLSRINSGFCVPSTKRFRLTNAKLSNTL